MRRLFLLAAMAPLFSLPAFGWGCVGHQIVALIARAHLAPATSAAVDDLLRANPIDPALNRFCKDGPNDPMADAATWADDVKTREKTFDWHFIDIPRGTQASIQTAASLDPWCPEIGPSIDGKDRPGCITKAIEYELGTLRDESRLPADRATALRYVIHFLGDIHQPLHDEDNDDEGGNCTALQFFAEAKPVNLHSIWDTRLLQLQLERSKQTETEFAAALNERFSEKFTSLSAAKTDDPVAWALETYALGESVTYSSLEPGIPVAAPGAKSVCADQREKVQALHIVVGQAYYDRAIPVIDERLATAGFRLAALLNQTLR
jgi:hypothetical protein